MVNDALEVVSGHLQEGKETQEDHEAHHSYRKEGTCEEPVPHEVSQAVQLGAQAESRLGERERGLAQS